MGLHQTKNGQVGQHKTTAKVVVACQMSTRRGATARLFPPSFRPERISTLTCITFNF
ncbi:MAG: hypothetical protein O4965_26885 [Trichodesmium sp. St19_bin1]|nr:hypothetical protein [Trichodesmium sp. St19_bin1]